MGSRLFRPLRLCLSFLILLGMFAGGCLAPETPRQPSLRERGPLADKYIRERLAVWQRRLNLQDWNISVVTTRASELRRRTMGNIRWDADKKTASIRVLDASDYPMPFPVALQDMEFTIVHELIHLELASMPRSEASRREEEFAVNHIAGALLQLDRKD